MLRFWLLSLAPSLTGIVVVLVVVRRDPGPRFGPWAALRRQYARYGTMGGRASRSEYWWPWLLYLLLDTVLQTAALLLGHGAAPLVSVLRAAVSAVAMLPGLALTARRLHDTGRSAWWSLLLVTVIGIPWVLWWLSRPSQLRPNPYGAAPGTSLWLPEAEAEAEAEGAERPWTTTGPSQHARLWSTTTVTAVVLLAVSDITTSLEVRPNASSGWAVLAQLLGGVLLAVGIIALRGAPLFTSSAPGGRLIADRTAWGPRPR